MRKAAERISRRYRGIGYNKHDAVGRFGMFYEELKPHIKAAK